MSQYSIVVDSRTNKKGKVYFFTSNQELMIGNRVEAEGNRPAAYSINMREGGYLSIIRGEIYCWEDNCHFSVVYDCFGGIDYPHVPGTESYFLDVV